MLGVQFQKLRGSLVMGTGVRCGFEELGFQNLEGQGLSPASLGRRVFLSEPQ